MGLLTEYVPYISPIREAARALRNKARYDASLEAGICSDSFQAMQGLSDAEYYYFLKKGEFMPDKRVGKEGNATQKD